MIGGRAPKIESRTTVPLLAMKKEEGKAMGKSQTPRRPQRASQSAQRRLSATQTRELASLKAKRASRLAAEASAARRRLITTLISLAVFVVFVGLAAASVLSWWWLFLPGFFLGGSLVTSRIAGAESQRRHSEELKSFRELRSEVPTPAEPQAKEAQKVRDMLAESVEASGPSAPAAEPVAESTSSEPVAVAKAETAPATSETWDVQPLPAPAHKRKSIIKGREVHADTDIAGVPRVQETPGRPVAATPVGKPAAEAEQATGTATQNGNFSFDLDAILDARRA